MMNYQRFNEPSSVTSRDLTKYYGDEKVLDFEGEEVVLDSGLTVIKGSSGSGKSTWLNTMAGFITPDTGSVEHRVHSEIVYTHGAEPSRVKRAMSKVAQRIVSQTPAEKRESRYRSLYTGYISQLPALHPELNLQDYTRLSHEIRGTSIDNELYDNIVGQLGLAKLLGKKPRQLSGGEAQRGAILTALVHKPEFIFADEPTSALDAKNKVTTMELMRGMVDDYGSKVLMVSHDPEAEDFADEIITLESGRIVSR